MPGNINSVLARFEQTIQENEVAGGGGGMYLTNVASTRKRPVRQPSSRRSIGEVSAGSYRNFLQNDAGGGGGMAAREKRHEAEFVEKDKDWDPFAEGNDQSGEFSDHSDLDWDEEEDGARAAKGSTVRRPVRPSTSKRVGRLGNRKTRTGQGASTRRTSVQAKEEEDVEEEDEDEASTSDHDEDDDGGASRDSSSRRETRPSKKDGKPRQRQRSTESSTTHRRRQGSTSNLSRSSTVRRPSSRRS